ncbi:DNA-directed RNA polymerase I subunit RPA43-like [Archocentrus centrarchus]|uniref:DNA-directed RNA polymerase I subunit RPA43-like n=1 Tax=Archocentrus centrarchus TaxID=63155 RepID=UPI0011E9C284|nr:DNA-directed RNA polymerase I subunit RPA43-like [Archocentrus centrarchus]XP_030597070.1 DNA-directed RNA polymerase I subunit RPA43-like [Archocentrus centrarchus]
MANFEHAEDNPKHVRISGEIPDASALNQTAEVPPVPGIAAVAVPLSIPSFAAASELLSAPYSCLVMNTHRRHIALPPVYLNKKKTGIKEELEAELLKFSQRMNGVPLAYDNIRIVGQLGDIYDDNGYIHVDVEANFIVFQPQKGQKLQGKVNKLGVSHVGCLVHGCFNASIPRPNLVSVETWRDAGPRIGADVEFHVTALDANTAGVLLIRGRLDRTRVQELLAMCESTGSSVPTDEQEPEDPEATQDASEDTPKKKKKKKKVKEQEAEEIPSIPACQQDSGVMPEPNGTTDEANGNEAGEKKKKKKKKEKHAKEEEEMELSRMELHGSDSSGYMSDKPNKKRKRESGSDVTSAFSEDPNPVKSKKKRKGEIEKFA